MVTGGPPCLGGPEGAPRQAVPSIFLTLPKVFFQILLQFGLNPSTGAPLPMSALSDGGAPAESRAPAVESGIQGAPGGPPPPLPEPVYGHPMSVFLSDRYLNLRVYDSKGEEERKFQAQALEQLRAQRAVEAFFRDGCLVRSAFMGLGGGVLAIQSEAVESSFTNFRVAELGCMYTGILLGSFFFTMKPVDVDTKLSLRAQLKEQYKTFVPEVSATAKNFAKIGALYSLTECLIDRVSSATEGAPSPLPFLYWGAPLLVLGAIYGGCITGALLAIRGTVICVAGLLSGIFNSPIDVCLLEKSARGLLEAAATQQQQQHSSIRPQQQQQRGWQQQTAAATT
ncbi:hypothetical protein Emag_005986 [Eimeria magna]